MMMARPLPDVGTSLAAVMYKSFKAAVKSELDVSKRRISSATESSNSSGVAYVFFKKKKVKKENTNKYG
jgi:hypothetical protein